MTVSISAIIAAYNCEETLGRALDSMLAQTCPPDEIIIVNDGSTDNTAEVIASYAEKHLNIQGVTQENSGPGTARNHGVKLAKSEWVAFLDSDDYWLPHHLENLSKVLEAHPDLSWTAAAYTNERSAKPVKFLTQTVLPNYLVIAHRRGNPVHTNTVLIRRSVFWECGGFREDWRRGEDRWLWLQIGLRYPEIGYSPIVSSVYCNCPNSLMAQVSSHQVMYKLFVSVLDQTIQDIENKNLFARKDVQIYVGGAISRALYLSLFVSNREYRKLRNEYHRFLPYTHLSFQTHFLRCLSLLGIPASHLHATAFHLCRYLHKVIKRKSHPIDRQLRRQNRGLQN